MNSLYENTYWNHKGKLQGQADALSKLVPHSGKCDPSTPKLEKYRRAANLYYHMFNDGRYSTIDKDSVSGLFKTKGKYVTGQEGSLEDQQAAIAKVEAAMDKIIHEAALEAVKP